VRILGIETSCDETAIAVVEDGRRILSNVIASQVTLHAEYGGVVPELASRQHVEAIIPVLDESLERAGCGLDDIDAIAITYGPGLAGALLVGANFGKALAMPSRPLISRPGEHLRRRLDNDRPVPGAALIVSGGHSDVVSWRARAGRLGETVATRQANFRPGRAASDSDFRTGGDRPPVTGRGGIAALAPRAQISRLKLAASRRRCSESCEGGRRRDSRLAARSGSRVIRWSAAAQAAMDSGARQIITAASPRTLLRSELVRRSPAPVIAPPPVLCTDNGAMIAACGYYRLQAGNVAPLDLDVEPGLRIG
jgi:N6-L-threonylcarbamoyladenine synthase